MPSGKSLGNGSFAGTKTYRARAWRVSHEFLTSNTLNVEYFLMLNSRAYLNGSTVKAD